PVIVRNPGPTTRSAAVPNLTHRWREMDSNFQFRARRAGVLTGLYRRRPSKSSCFHQNDPFSCARDRWFESVSLQRRVCEFSVRERLPPRQTSSDGKERLGRTSKRGEKYIGYPP